jgi:hypothetical protein
MGKLPVPSLVVIHWISVKSFIEAGPERPQPLSFMPPSGSWYFVEAASQTLVQSGYPPQRVKTERFGGTGGT